MERRVSYALIGFSFIASLVGLVVFIFWFSNSGIFGDSMKTYKVYSAKALGIKIKTPVRFKGIGVGSVRDIRFRDSGFNEIEVLVDINANLPIKKDSVLLVAQDGLLGSNYLSLIQNQNSDSIISDENEAILSIKEENIMSAFGAIPGITNKIDGIVDSANDIMSKENIASISAILLSIKEISNNMNAIMKSLQGNTENIDAILANLNAATKATESTIELINKKVKSGEYDVKSTIAPVLISLEETLNNLNDVAQKGSNMLNDFRENPYNTIFGYREEK